MKPSKFIDLFESSYSFQSAGFQIYLKFLIKQRNSNKIEDISNQTYVFLVKSIKTSLDPAIDS